MKTQLNLLFLLLSSQVAFADVTSFGDDSQELKTTSPMWPKHLEVSGANYPNDSSGEYSLKENYGNGPVYSNGVYSLYQRENGHWVLDFNEISEVWDGTVNYTTAPQTFPWDGTWSGTASILPSTVYVSGANYPFASSGEYHIVDSYNGMPVYSNESYMLYQRKNGIWVLDFNEVSEDWDGTVNYTTKPQSKPWGGFWNGKTLVIL
ncbi:hypothetical protein [Algicola sagamiensis]|uniref:hypothetical protein n=1 Tax=Algicola sagamiensis TaxID=163869 RepID=UPI000370D022|nr:hypothetical protein [Algicola sagamiensis]